MRGDFLEHIHFFLIIMAGEQVESLEQFFTEHFVIFTAVTWIFWNTYLEVMMILLICLIYSLADVKS